MSTHNLCFDQKYEKYQIFLSENFQFLEVKFSIHLNRRVYVMLNTLSRKYSLMCDLITPRFYFCLKQTQTNL